MHITHSSRKVIVLERDSQGYIAVVLGCLISAISFIFGMNYVAHDLSFPIGTVLCASSLLFALVPLLIWRSIRRNEIQRMVFRHDKGLLSVECGNAKSQNTALLSYSEIHSFALRSSDAQTKTRDESGFFDLVMFFRDASSISVLTNIYGSQTAESLLKLFQRSVDNSVETSQGSYAQMPSWFQFQHAATPSFSWTLAQPRLASVFVILFFCLFFTLLYWFFIQIPNDIFFYLVLGFIASVGVFVLVSLVAKILGSRRTLTTLSLHDQQLTLRTESQSFQSGSSSSSLGTTPVKSEQSVPLNDVAMMGFSPYGVGTSARLYVLSPEALARAQELLHATAEPAKWRLNLQANLDEMVLLHTLPFVDLGERSIVQLLQARSFVNAVLKSFEVRGHWQPSAMQTTELTPVQSWDEVSGGDIAEDAESMRGRSLWATWFYKLMHPRMVGMLALLNCTLPALALFAALPLEGRARASQLVWIFQSLNTVYFVILFLVCFRILHMRSLRLLGVVLTISSISYGSTLLGVNPSGLSLGFQLFVVSIMLVISGWRLLRTPGASHANWAELEEG